MFFDIIAVFRQSPVYQLRHLVAPASVAMVTMSEMSSAVMTCVMDEIMLKENNSSNLIHGNLLFVNNGIELLKE